MQRLRALVPLLLVPLAAHASESFLKDGEHWVMVGDSITNIGTFERLTGRVIRHFHPEAAIRIGNEAVNGVTADVEAKVSGSPTLVSIMLGMNDVIHRHHAFTPDPSPFLEAYRKSITAKVRTYREQGADVLLLTPTYTDERRHTAFANAMTRRLLEGFGDVVREIAASEEQCFWVPAAEEFEAYQDSLGPNQFLRHDGVHPYGFGQYQIARTLWRHLNVRGALSPQRVLTRDGQDAPVHAALPQRFLHEPEDGLTVELTSASQREVALTWSLGGARGTERVTVGPGTLAYALPVPAEELDQEVGTERWLVFDITDGERCSVYVLGLARVPVLKPENGVLRGTIVADGDRPEGKTVGTWEVRERDDELWFSGDVYDGELDGDTYWMFSRDGLHLWLDLRPPERFGVPTIEEEVLNSLVLVEDDPLFSVTHVPWVNTQLGYAVEVGGAPLDGGTGYRWHLGLRHRFSTSRVVDIRKHDVYGFNLYVIDRDTDPAVGTQLHFAFPPHLKDPGAGVGLFPVVDRTGTIPGDTTTKLTLFGP